MKTLSKALALTTLVGSLSFLSSSVFAATVPEGTALAENQELKLSLAANPTTIDISQIQEAVGFELCNQLYEPLVVFDEHGKLQPGAATSWEHSPDFKTWTFHLRKDAKYSDGSPVKAQDFVTAWTRLLDPNNAFIYSFYLVDLNLKGAAEFNEGKGKAEDLGLKALDDYTFQVTLNNSVPWFLEAAAIVILSPLPTDLVNAGKWPNLDNLVTNGAYKLDSSRANDSFVLSRNKHYWDDKNTVINKVTYYVVPQNTSAFKRLQSGELDGVELATPSLLPLAQESKDLEVLTNTGPSLSYYTFDFRKKPFTDIKVRKAFQLAIDTKLLGEKALRGTVYPTSNFIPTSVPHGDEMQEAAYFNQDMDSRRAEAKKLLTEAGYTADNPLEFTLDYSNSELKKTLSIGVVGQLKKAFGDAVKVQMRNSEWKTFLQDRAAGKFSFWASGWGADYSEASTFTTIWTCNSTINDGKYCNPEYDKAFDALYTTKTEEERTELYKKMNAILQADVPAVMFYSTKDIWAIKPNLKGLNTNVNYRFVNKMYLTK